MVDEIKPYQLVEIYHQSRHTRVNSWVYSVLAGFSALVGFGLQFSELPRRSEGAIACWISSAALCNRAKSATEQAEKYQHRRDVLEWASEEAQLSAIVKSIQPSLASIQLAAAQPTERPLMLPAGTSQLEAFASAVQQLLAEHLEIRTDYVNAIAGPQLVQLQLRPHDLKKIKQLQSDGVADSIQALLSLADAPVLTLEKGAIALSIPRPDRQFCHFADYIHDPTDGAMRMAIGVNVRGELIEEELSGDRLQHFVVGGAPRQGKSQWILSAMGSLVDRYSPQQIQFICGDGKGGVTLGFMKGSPYLLQPVAYTREDAAELVKYLKELVSDRYAQFRTVGAQTIDDYASITGKPMPYIGVFLDEFQDLFTLDPRSAELPILESLASLAPAAGVFFVWSSQRIDGKLLPPQINSKCLSRLCLKVQKDRDSEFVLNGDTSGVNLLGQGDLIYDDGHNVQRLQGLYLPHRDTVFKPSLAALLPKPLDCAQPKLIENPQTLEQFSQEFEVRSPVQFLENCLGKSDKQQEETEIDLADENLKSLAQYLKKKCEAPMRDVKDSWGKNRKLKAEQVDQLLIELHAIGLIETYTPEGSKGVWVKWQK